MASSNPDDRGRSAGQLRIVVRSALVSFAGVALGGLVYVIAVTPPTPDSFYPKCVFYHLTGLHCPGCGTGRAAHAALNGRFLDALQCNVYSLIVVPVLLFLAAKWAVRWVLGIPAPPRRPLNANWIRLFLVALLLFWLLRNIRLYPFTLLAPTDPG